MRRRQPMLMKEFHSIQFKDNVLVCYVGRREESRDATDAGSVFKVSV